ncbi:hypothetical protein PBCVNY2B_490L [Paramecium bursaria Chlorella virus NY2B]|uniref:Uncharacterized protein n=1 Tax=Paramecium bursaria Chlorella virus NYs1 TaxID=83442 RepID=M1I3B8_9PHYC|nr:hypothetical protein AR158_C429L [Paramecium bursaria Chlorella virus AR158]YP_009665402.1 hypothetical protein FK949_gp368 [Paramecium bursaria Chlorella virus NYs1]AGE54258.1 hypothetical protein PBCVIL52s1_510L [Paramecium bursaria Chlorella virus IL-5-2s1]AGE54897.1 hypothetical protein PBCVMA1D_373L [Paramecium bursaria Chlorella virus MA1D]AGE58372.1 hypothetical protein PBCVNY2B_490L [Paramecium bursaria Chlorella virus NY2B]ABU43974.1 hypothetical protein AR158_C429L [Paramecium bur
MSITIKSYDDLPIDITRDIYTVAIKLRDEDVRHEVRRSIFDLIGSLFKNEFDFATIRIPGTTLEVFSFYTETLGDDIKTTCLEFTVGSVEYSIQYIRYGASEDDVECCMGILSVDTDKYTEIVCDVLIQYFPDGVIYTS